MTTTPVESFLAEAFQQGVRLWVEDGRLRCTGPRTVLTGPLGAEIKARKPAIMGFLAGDTPVAAPPIPALNASHPPLSPAQMRIWLVDQMRGGAAPHHIPLALEVLGQPDLAAVNSALTALVARHAVLRMRIDAQGGSPQQRIAAKAVAPVAHLMAVAMPEGDLDAFIAEEAARPFDLASEPPLRLCILQRAADRHIFVFTLHHIAADGGSVEILLAEFAALFTAALAGNALSLPPLPIQYGDFAAWQHAMAQDRGQMDFWASRLGADLPVTQLPTDFPRPVLQSHAGAYLPLVIPPAVADALRGLAAARGASPFAALLTAFKLLVARYTGQTDLVIGIPAANRRRAETEPLVGLFVNPLPLRSRIDLDAGFVQVLDSVQAELLAALDHQDMPFERLVEEFLPFRDPGTSPLFQLKFQLDRATRQSLHLPGLELRRLPRRAAAARHDLSLDLTDGPEGVQGHIEYCTDLFRPETMGALAENFQTLLAALVAQPEHPVGRLDLLAPAQRHRQLVTWNDTATPLDRAERFPALFEAHAAATPGAIAVEYVSGDAVVTETYGALNARANRLAHALRQRGAGPDSVIGIALNRGPDMIAAWLAVWKAGAAYLPLDPAYPAERLAYMLADSGAALVLSHSAMPLPGDVARLNLDAGWPEGAMENPRPGTDPDDLAYLIYTSGSTGRPKGVLVPHEGLVNLTRGKIRNCDVWPGDKMLNFFSFSFDASIPELVMSLGAGATLLLAPTDAVLPGPGLARLLRERRVTHLTMTPSALASLSDGDYPDLKMVLVGGEAPSPELVARWSAGRIFINAYGPTETTVNASMVVCGNGQPPEPTLRAPANKQLYVLDSRLQPLPAGCPGELFIGGLGLARGYHGRPDLTAAAFLPDPFATSHAGRIYRTGDRACQLPDGRIRLLGRSDHQVKIRGYRIEPGEIERACLAHPQVASALVTTREGAGGVPQLLAYLVPRGAVPEAFRQDHLMPRLPRYMLPDAVVWLKALPLTVNGKLDLSALPTPDALAEGRAPDGPAEMALAEIFGTVLGLDQVPAEADFFELGGHSLLATRLVAAIEDRFGITLKVMDLFNAPSVAAMARHITAGKTTAREADDGWRADVVLEAALHPAAPTAQPSGLPQRVLLTGATGFLGAFLLRELLRDPRCEVMCLLRGGDLGRIEATLRHYGLWEPGLAARIHPVAGDLAQPGLGLSSADRARILAEAGAIFHCGAEVHHLTPYRALRATNVEGTREVLRLAMAGAGRPLHYISTLSAFAARQGDSFRESDRMADMPPPLGGYNLSKWVAERLVAEAGQRGLPVTIHRVGSLSGHSETGAFNAADILSLQVRGYLASGSAPQGAALLNLVPVDYAAMAIRHLAAQGRAGVFHLTHSATVSADLLFAASAAEGHTLRRVPPQDWQTMLRDIARGEPSHPLFPLASLGGAQGFAGAVWPYDCTATRAALADAPRAEPPLTEALLRRYIRAFIQAGTARHPAPEERLP